MDAKFGSMWLTTGLVTTFLYNLRSAVETIKHHTRSILKKVRCGKAHTAPAVPLTNVN